MRRHLLMLCSIMAFVTLTVSAEDQVYKGLDAAVSKASERVALSSAEGASGVLRIVYGDTVLLESEFGSASCLKSEDMTADHIFMIGSITKEFTRVLGFVLEEEDAISLDDTVSQRLPGFRGPIGSVTIQQLMDHTGGLPDIIDKDGQPIAYSVEYDYEPVSRDQLIARAELADLVSQPGKARQYSNLGYQLLAAIYEVVSGKTYSDLLRSHIYSKANMENTDFSFQNLESRSFVDGCRSNNEYWGNPVDTGKWDESGPSWNLLGAGGLLSTTEDLRRFFDGIATGVYFDDPDQLEKYKSSRMVFSERRQQRIMASAGSNGIFNAAVFWADDDRFSVIVMTNRSDHPAEGGLFQDIVGFFPPDVFGGHDNY